MIDRRKLGRDELGFVYVAWREDKRGMVVKIGYSYNPKRRLSELQHGEGPYHLIGCMPGTKEDELAITSRLREWAIPGACGGVSMDWFRYTDEVISILSHLPLGPLPKKTKA